MKMRNGEYEAKRYPDGITGIIGTAGMGAVLWLMVCAMFWLSVGIAAAEETATAPISQTERMDELIDRFEIKLEEGCVTLGDLLAEMMNYFSIDGEGVREHVDMTLDLTAKTGQGVLKLIERMTDDVVTFEISDEWLIVKVDRLKWRQNKQRVKRAISGFAMGWYHADEKAAAKMYGLKLCEADGNRLAIEQGVIIEGQVVVLIHGLDEPGMIWDRLRPTLQGMGYTVVEFDYPNDQSVMNSSALFADNLKLIRKLGVEKIDVVAHSMGGLVTRAVLADEKFYGGKGRREGYPAIARFIMVGTPNHGSKMAKLRFVSEMNEQIVRMFSGDGLLFGSVFDGSGEAKTDLLPGSKLLTWLNSQPLPEGVEITIVAGKASPVSEKKLSKWVKQMKEMTGDELDDDEIAEIDAAVASVVNGVGDGVVTIESTRLAGVTDHVIVEGNHLTMLNNILAGKESQPAAVGVVVERLGEAGGGEE